MEWDYSGRKIDEVSKKGKNGKVRDLKNRVKGGEVGKRRDNGVCSGPTHGELHKTNKPCDQCRPLP